MAKGSIINRGSSWLVKYDADPKNGKRNIQYRTVRGHRRDAEAVLHRQLAQVKDGTHIDSSRSTLGQWLNEWLVDYAKPEVSPKTFERYNQLIGIHIIPHVGSIPVQKFSEGHIASFFRTHREQVGGLSESTLLHVHRVLKTALKKAHSMRVIQRNPMAEMKGPKINASARAKINALESTEAIRLLKHFREHSLFPIVALALSTGLRRGEIIALRWGDVDLERGCILVQRSAEETNEGVRFKDPKSQSSGRRIGIDQSLINILAGLKREHTPQNLIFPRSSLEPNRQLRGYQITKNFNKYARKAGFCVRFHDLRHTHCTYLLTEGVPVNAVAQRLGHSSPAITLSVYGHVLRRSEDQAAKVAGALLDSIADS